MRPDIVSGALFPDYELSDHRGMRRTISALQGGDPLVLVLSRGGFCPKERRQHEGLLQLHREMQVGYCRLVTISTDNLLETNEFRTAVGGGWTFLSDPGRRVQKDLDIAEYTDPDHNPMIPHTVVLEPGLRVYRIYNGSGFSGGRRWKNCVTISGTCCSAAVRTGTLAALSSEKRGRWAIRRSSTRTERRARRCWPKKIESD
jgi:peroxiredoxin